MAAKPKKDDGAADLPVMYATFKLLAGEEIANGVENLLSVTQTASQTERRRSNEDGCWYVDAAIYGNVERSSVAPFAARAEEILGVESGTIQVESLTQ